MLVVFKRGAQVLVPNIEKTTIYIQLLTYRFRFHEMRRTEL